MNPAKTLSQRSLRSLTALAAAAALCACGGSGGDGADAAGAGGATAGGGSSSTAGSGSTGSTGGTGAGTGSGTGTGSGSGVGSGTGTSSGTGSGTGSGSGSGSGTGGSSGAGGSGSDASGTGATGGTGQPGAANVPAAGTLQISVPTANYAGGSTEGAAWRDLNTARVLAGAGQLMQSTELDTAAAKHANYLVRNLGATGHGEAPAKFDYYEATPGSRIAKAGFGASFWAEAISDQRPQVVPLGFDCAGELLNTVYNAALLLGPATHVGLRGWDGTFSGTMFCIGLVAAPTNQPDGQVVPAGKMVAYPYDGQTGVVDSVNLQVESPRPSLTVLPNQLAGTPVIVNLRNADYLKLLAAGTLNPRITQFRLTDAGGNVVQAALLTHAGLGAGNGVVRHEDAMLPIGAAVLVPLAPLPRSQTYTVSFSATLKDGGPVLDKTWSFTTRP